MEWASRMVGALCLILIGCRGPLDPVVIRFHGVDIRRSAFLTELETLAKTGTDVAETGTRASAFGRYVEGRLVAIAASQNGFKDALRDRAEAERWLASAVSPPSVSESEARAYYLSHPEVAQVFESVTLREILLSTEQDARDVVRILGSDRNAFELLARTRSRSPQAQSGGRLGSFKRGELPPEIERAVLPLSAGQTTGIVASSFGYHVLRVESKTAAAVRSFTDSRSAIDARLTEAKARLRMKEVIDGLVSQAQVNHEAITAR